MAVKGSATDHCPRAVGMGWIPRSEPVPSFPTNHRCAWPQVSRRGRQIWLAAGRRAPFGRLIPAPFPEKTKPKQQQAS